MRITVRACLSVMSCLCAGRYLANYLSQPAALNNTLNIGEAAEGDSQVVSGWAEGSNTAIAVTFVCSRGESYSPANGDVMNRYSGEASLLKT